MSETKVEIPGDTHQPEYYSTQDTHQPEYYSTQDTHQPEYYSTQDTHQPEYYSTQDTHQPEYYSTQDTHQPEYYSTQDTHQPPIDKSIKKTMNSELPDHDLEANKIRKIKPHIIDQPFEEKDENIFEPVHQQTPERKEDKQVGEPFQSDIIDKFHTIKPHNLKENLDDKVRNEALILHDPHKEIQQVPDTSHREEERSAEQQHQHSTSEQPQQPPQQPLQPTINITSNEDNNTNKNENAPTSPDMAHPRGNEQSEQQLLSTNDNELNILYLSETYKNTKGTKQGGQKLSKTKDKFNATIGSIKDKFVKLVKTEKQKEKKAEHSLSEENTKSDKLLHQDLETKLS
ncbi:hypothetical protein Glove_14g53 [Diversispora epigaea]|uniref:Uncharacterized protein n=1 Tax=Diversispora epigaea TaxID=1348612 RepID=A0A397JW26_9GLOM|nr:hypothetical protein Glove_14g53 [Diversispora epigaea]